MRILALTATLLLAGCANAPAPVAKAPAPPTAPLPAPTPAEAAKPPAQLQYLYGSPEATVAVRAPRASGSARPAASQIASALLGCLFTEDVPKSVETRGM